MKKAFLAVITALSLAGFSYAQDDEYEEEEVVYEDEAPAPAAKASGKQKVVYEEVDEDEEADVPAAPAKKKKASKPSVPNENGTFGVGAELIGLDRIRLVYNLNASMAIVGLLDFGYQSVDVPGRTHSDGSTDVASESAWEAAIGAGFMYTMPTPVLPVFGEADLVIGTTYEDHFTFDMDLFFGVKASIIKGLELAGQAGIMFGYESWDVGVTDFSAFSMGLGAKVYATWYFM